MTSILAHVQVVSTRFARTYLGARSNCRVALGQRDKRVVRVTGDGCRIAKSMQADSWKGSVERKLSTGVSMCSPATRLAPIPTVSSWGLVKLGSPSANDGQSYKCWNQKPVVEQDPVLHLAASVETKQHGGDAYSRHHNSNCDYRRRICSRHESVQLFVTSSRRFTHHGPRCARKPKTWRES